MDKRLISLAQVCSEQRYIVQKRMEFGSEVILRRRWLDKEISWDEFENPSDYIIFQKRRLQPH